jgi:hypothetical protein
LNLVGPASSVSAYVSNCCLTSICILTAQ